MKIKELYISEFGGIKNKAIKFDSDRGLTVIYGENESGKSTVLLFIKFMLYGLQRRSQSNIERERSLSWSGSVASGSMILEHCGRDYKIERTFSDRSRVPERISIVALDSGIPVSTEKSPGEYFLGVPREVFESSACVGQMRSGDINGEKTAQSLSNMLSSADESVDTASVLKELNSIRTSYMHKNQAGGSIFEDEAKINSLRLKLDEAKNASLAIEGKTESFERAKAEYDALRLDLEKKDALVGQFNKIALIKRFETLRAKEAELPAISQKKELCAKGFLKTDFFPDRTHAAELRAAAREIDERERALSAKETEKKAHTLGFDVKDAERGEIAEADGGKAEILAPVSKAKADAKRLKDIYIGLGAGSVISVAAGIVLTAFFGILTGVGFFIAAGLLSVAAVGIAVRAAKRKKEADSIASSLKEQYCADESNLADRIEECLKALALKRAYDSKNVRLDAELAIAEEAYEAARVRAYSLLKLTLGESAEPEYSELVSEAQRVTEFLDDYDALAREEDAFLRMLENERQLLSRYDEEKLKSEITVSIEDATPEAVEAAERERSFYTAKRTALEGRLTLLQNELIALRIKAENPIPIADRLAELEEKVRKDRAFYNALILAMNTIEDASAAMRGNVTPVISKSASEILSRISNQKYNALRASAQLGVTLDIDGFGVSSELLSAGTRDAAYLALRIALILQIFGDERPPVIFDESLCQLDDKRHIGAMELFCSLASEGMQIILFTSHSREEKACLALGAEYELITL